MTGRRFKQTVEMVLLAPATFFLFPFLLVGALGMVMAEVAGGAIDPALAGQIFWVLAGAVGMVALWVVVLDDTGVRLRRGVRAALTLCLLLGIASAVRWLWATSTSGHKYGAATWAVWIVLLGGPLAVGSLRLVQLWKSHQEETGSDAI